MNLSTENRNSLISIAIAGFLAWILSLIPVWQLIIIAGIVTGLLNKTMRRGTLCAAAGVGICWLALMIYGMVSINAYTMLDQFGGLLGLKGMAWVLFVIILLVGTMFGALGGAIGSGLLIVGKHFLNTTSDQQKLDNKEKSKTKSE
ncbi:MAG: hypothetical protein ACTSWY_07370 [Promethearchaeota archaeon]